MVLVPVYKVVKAFLDDQGTSTDNKNTFPELYYPLDCGNNKQAWGWSSTDEPDW
jgi:hypothetical protein